MPSPIAHAVSGYAITKLFGRKCDQQRLMPFLLFYGVFVAIAPDFDFLPQLVAGVDMHRGFTHSIGFAIAFSLTISPFISRFIHARKELKSLQYQQVWILTLLVYCSHLALDFFTQGGAGVPLLWPLSNSPFQSALPLFPAVHHSRGLFDRSHLLFISFELTYSAILLWTLSRWQPTRTNEPIEYQDSIEHQDSFDQACLK